MHCRVLPCSWMRSLGGVEGLKVGMEVIEQVVEEGLELHVELRMVDQDEWWASELICLSMANILES